MTIAVFCSGLYACLPILLLLFHCNWTEGVAIATFFLLLSR